MQELQDKLAATASAALHALFNVELEGEKIAFQETRPEFVGDFTLVVFPFTKGSKLSPEATGEAIGAYMLANSPMIASYNTVKGFLNMELKPSVWLQTLQAGVGHYTLPARGEKVLVEYSSPNTNKPLHLGHKRTNFLGLAMARIFADAGYEATTANLVNDRGIHICKSMVAYRQLGQGETPESSGMKGDKLVGKYYVEFDRLHKAQIADLVAKGVSDEDAAKQTPIMQAAQAELRAWEKGDPDTMALWTLMNGWVYDGFAVTYKRFGVTFDKYYYESETYLLGKDIVEEGLAKGVFYKEANGSVWIDLTPDGLDKKLVLRADGTSVYITQDLGTADLKYDDFGANRSVYVVGNEQDYHFQVLFLILKKLGRPYAAGLHHLSYGMVDLPSGKMKSREGTVVDADDLMEEMVQTARARTEELGKFDSFNPEEQTALYEMLGMGAIKYYLLRVDPKKRILFNPEESIDLHGNTATAIQYTHARIKSVLRKATEQGITPDVEAVASYAQMQKEEKALVVLLYQYKAVLNKAANEYAPYLVAQHCYELCRAFNSFFAAQSILQADMDAERNFRLVLAREVAGVLERAMGLLGIALPERM